MRLIKRLISIIVILIVCVIIDSCSGSKRIVLSPPPPPAPLTVSDRDGDGVLDVDDRCPDVAGFASLGGCPDRDGDGITDAEDKCGNVPGLPRYWGCPIPDTDGDGFNDEEDKCINVKGPVSNFGCPVMSEEIIKSVGNPGIKDLPKKDSIIHLPQTGNSSPDNSQTENKIKIDTIQAKTLPEASIAYSYRGIMKKGETREIRMKVQLGKAVANVRQDLLDRINQDEHPAKMSGRTDTSIIKTLLLAGYKYFKVIPKYNKKIFSIEFRTDSVQQLDSLKPTNWLWMVTALQATENEIITLHVTGIDEKGVEHYIDDGDLPIKVNVKNKSFAYGWLTAIILFILLITGLIIWIKRKKEAGYMQIFFSYNWGHMELKALVDELYISLKKGGFNVVKDKEDLRYAGSISSFMTDLSKSKFLIVAVSEKYLKSVNCMKELFHIYSNAGMNKIEFQKRIFPLTTEQLNLSKLDVVKGYTLYWKQEEQKWKIYIRENSASVTAEQTNEYEFIRRLVSEISNLLSYLYDINTLSIEELRNNDFEKIKNAISKAIRKK